MPPKLKDADKTKGYSTSISNPGIDRIHIKEMTCLLMESRLASTQTCLKLEKFHYFGMRFLYRKEVAVLNWYICSYWNTKFLMYLFSRTSQLDPSRRFFLDFEWWNNFVEKMQYKSLLKQEAQMIKYWRQRNISERIRCVIIFITD